MSTTVKANLASDLKPSQKLSDKEVAARAYSLPLLLKGKKMLTNSIVNRYIYIPASW